MIPNTVKHDYSEHPGAAKTVCYIKTFLTFNIFVIYLFIRKQVKFTLCVNS